MAQTWSEDEFLCHHLLRTGIRSGLICCVSLYCLLRLVIFGMLAFNTYWPEPSPRSSTQLVIQFISTMNADMWDVPAGYSSFVSPSCEFWCKSFIRDERCTEFKASPLLCSLSLPSWWVYQSFKQADSTSCILPNDTQILSESTMWGYSRSTKGPWPWLLCVCVCFPQLGQNPCVSRKRAPCWQRDVNTRTPKHPNTTLPQHKNTQLGK